MPIQEPGNSLKNFLANLLRLRSQQTAAPEPSHFDRPEPDREQEREQARRKSQDQSAHRQSVRIAGPDPLDKHPFESSRDKARSRFEIASGSKSIREQQEFEERFLTEEARENARECMDDAKALREEAEKQFFRELDAVQRKWDRVDLTRPVPPELVIHLKGLETQARENRQREMKEIEQDLHIALAEVASQWMTIDIGLIPKERRIGYTPDASEHFARAAQQSLEASEFAGLFNQASALPEPDDEMDWPEEFAKTNQAQPPRPGPVAEMDR